MKFRMLKKVEKAEKVCANSVSDQENGPHRKRRSGRLQSNPTKSSSATSPSSPPPTPSASSAPKQQLKCGRCSSILKSERRWQEHLAAVHGGKARLAEDPLGQDFTPAEEEKAFKEAFSFSKQVSCPRCNDVFFTLKSKLVNHLKKCKVEEALLPLPAEEHSQEEISVKSESKVKRRAATKAQGRVAEFVRQMKTKFEGESSEADADEDISEDSDDNYDVKNEAEVSALYRVVRNDAKRSCYQCGVCGDKFVSRGEVESHVVTQHQAQMVADDDDDEDDTEDDEEDSDPDYSHGKPRYKRQSDAPLTGPRKPLLEPCPDMVEMEHIFRSKFYNLNDFPSLPVKMPDWVPVEQDTSFLPASSISARFTVTNLSKEVEEQEVRILESFSGGLINNSPMFFCGGPVTAMAWCPMDKTDEVDQVMAVVAKLDYNPTSHSEEGEGKGLIQIWRLLLFSLG